jgi:hypothetical protein
VENEFPQVAPEVLGFVPQPVDIWPDAGETPVERAKQLLQKLKKI